MKGIEVPGRTEDFTADPVELFFDLAYVFAFSQLVGQLVDEPDWTGVGRAALATATSTALAAGGPVFAVTLGVIMALGFLTQTLSVDRGSTFHRAVMRWVTPSAIALIVLVAGAFVDGRGRIVLWLLSLAIVLGAMIAAGRGDWIIRSGHFAERHGLIVIIALGEVVVAMLPGDLTVAEAKRLARFITTLPLDAEA